MSGDKFDKANSFIAKLKAHGTKSDMCDLEEVYESYKNILTELPTKDRGSFSLNVLCILCRNIEKVPTWREKICKAQLLELSVCCLRQTRPLDKTDQVKTLACIYHIHKYLVRQDTILQAALLLKLSYMPFEVTEEFLQRDHSKVYWSILADRIFYIEKLKSTRNINDLLKKLYDDIKTLIKIYNPVQFCSNVLTFIVKKLYFLYSDIRMEELMVVYRNIFDCITTKDNINVFQSITNDEAIDIYIKLNDCLYVIIENDSKVHFKGSDLEILVRKIILLFGHCSDIFHCLQMIYLNCFCCIFKYRNNSDYINTVLDGLQNNCETAEKLGYKKIMYVTYPYISELLRLFIDNFINNQMDFNTIQNCLKMIMYLIDKLYKTQQISKCENCSVKTGLHDALRLTFLTKNIINKCIEENMDIKMIFQDYFNIVLKQYVILYQLKQLNCSNYDKCLKKLQADVHNTAIVLNKAKFCEYSIKMFNIYVKNEIYHVKSDAEFRNIARAFYNKSICELDCMLFDEAIKDAYMSLVFSGDGLHEKYMSLVMDIKAKALKNDGNDAMQLLTVLTVCKDLSEKKDYVNLKPFFSNLKFSVLLKHEFSMYVKLWPSIVPIAGVWMSLNELTKNLHTSWLKGENEEDLLYILYEIMMETPSAVRTIHSDYYKNIVAEILQRIQEKPNKKIEERIMQANLLFLQSEYDISEATEKYGWKQIDPTLSPEQIKNLRTLPQEQPALKHAVDAVELWTEILPKLNTANPTLVQHSLRIAEVFVQQLLYTQRVQQGLQLAHVCCELARRLGDKKAYISNLGVILQYVNKPLDRVEQMLTDAIKYWQELISSKQHLEAMLVFACDLAMYYDRCGSSTSDKLLQFVQARILEEEVNLDLAVGRLLEAHAQIHDTPDILTRVSAPLRHYVTVANNETTWVSRRHRSLLLRIYTCCAALVAGRGGRALWLWRRARTLLCAALRSASAMTTADIYTVYIDTNAEDAEVNIDRIKHILGLQPTNEIQPHTIHKEEQHTPKHTQIETMLKSTTFRRLQTSPSSPLVTSSFTMPEFLKHNEICQCYACQVPCSFLIATRTCLLEASMYYRSNDFHIARNYFDGATEALKLTKEKLLNSAGKSKCEKYISDIIKDSWNKEIELIEAEMLIEESYMELSQNDFTNINNKLIRLDEITKEIKIDLYLQTEINNLLIATSRLKRAIQKKEEDALEIEMEHLSLSPNTKLIKTPESKKIPLKGTNKIVKQNELPSLNYKISKLNLDGENYDEKEQIKEIKKPKFKIPEPVISRPILETLTPRPKTRVNAETTTHLAKTRVKTETTPIAKMLIINTNMTPGLKTDLGTTATFSKTTQTFESTTFPKTRQKSETTTTFSKTTTFPKTTQKLETTPLPKTTQKFETTTFPKTTQKLETTTFPKTTQKLETTTLPKTTQKFETTPLPTRVKIVLTQASQEQGTPKTEEFFTPSSTPSEQFFTPMSSVKTYKRKKTAIVKNLENEFSTPQVDIEKENKAGVRTRRAVSSRLNPR